MKHWIDFLEPKTLSLKRTGKLASTLTYEVQDKELQLQNAKENLERLECQIRNQIANNYASAVEVETAILYAKNKADKWNNEPIESHIPRSKKIIN